jgi:hypothetical protein
MSALRAALLGGVVALGAACSQSSPLPPPLSQYGTQPPPGGGGSGGDAGAAGGDAAGCLAFASSGSLIAQVYVGENLPQPIGGAVATGNYVLTNVNVYTGAMGNTGPTGALYQETLSLQVGTFNDVTAVGDSEAGVGNPVYSGGTYSTAATMFTEDESCPTIQSLGYAYTSSGTQLRLYQGQTELVLALQ